MLGMVVIQGVGRESSMILKVKQVYVVKKSKYQEIIVADVEEFGRCLILDGYVQSAESDEHVYHELLVHPAMIVHPNPVKVLIIGGGEGAALREVLKHNSVQRAFMVDIDEDVVAVSKEFLPMMHRNSFYDPRSTVIIADGLKFLAETADTYDVVILDLTDPYASDIARQLYAESFYQMVYERLSEDGVMVTQAGSAFFYREVYSKIISAVKNVYPYHLEYQIWIPSFGYACNFILGSKRLDPRKHLKREYIDEILSRRGVSTRFIDGLKLEAIVNLGVY